VRPFKIKGFLLLYLMLFPLLVSAQMVDKSGKLDSLTIAERISIRTNSVDWLLLVPNVSVEFDLGKYNWSRYSVAVGVKGNWKTYQTFKPAQVYNIGEVRGEFRQYWRTRQINNDTTDVTKVTSVMPAKNILQRLFSTNRYRLKHPNTTYYRGVYAAYTKYSLLLAKKGKQGSALSAGLTYGIIKPLYQFKSGNSLDLEFGVSGGLCFTKYDEFRHDRESDCYPVLARNGWKVLPYPMLSEVRVAFVYRLGSHPITNKYHWRYDVDPAYREKIDAKLTEKTQKKAQKMDMDGLRKKFDELFKLYYPNELKKAEKNASQQKAAAEKAAEKKKADAALASEQKKAAIEAEKQKKADEKAAEKQKKAAEKQKKADEKAAEKQEQVEEEVSEKPENSQEPVEEDTSEKQEETQEPVEDETPENQDESKDPVEEETPVEETEKGGEQ